LPLSPLAHVSVGHVNILCIHSCPWTLFYRLHMRRSLIPCTGHVKTQNMKRWSRSYRLGRSPCFHYINQVSLVRLMHGKKRAGHWWIAVQRCSCHYSICLNQFFLISILLVKQSPGAQITGRTGRGDQVRDGKRILRPVQALYCAGPFMRPRIPTSVSGSAANCSCFSPSSHHSSSNSYWCATGPTSRHVILPNSCLVSV
jgi:hypothetical protein